METKAVVDRIVGDMAVLLVGPAERSVDFPLACLPPVHEGSVLRLTVRVDAGAESDRRRQAQALIDKLKSKNG